MSVFSFKEALEKLHIDPYPTKSFRDLVSLLRNITKMMKTTQEMPTCPATDLIANLSNISDGIKQNATRLFVRNYEVQQVFTENLVPQTFNHLLFKLLSYIIIKLSKCEGEDAASIIYDFDELTALVLEYRRYSTWDNTETDKLITMFQNKLIRMVKGLNRDNRDSKFQLFNITRIMIIELGKHPFFQEPTIKDLNSEIQSFYELVKSLPNGDNVDVYILEHHLIYLYVLNNLIGSNLRCNNKEILRHLKTILTKIVALNKMRPRESYLTHTILNTLELILK